MSNLPDDVTARLRHSLGRNAAPELSADIVTGAADRAAPRMTHPARRLRVAGGITVAVASIAVAALVITPGLQRAPLFTAGAASSASALSAAEGTVSSDMRIGRWIDYRYTAGPNLSTDGGSGHVYQLERIGAAESRAAQIASVFGIDGSPSLTEYSDPAYPTWSVGPSDGTAPSVTVTWAGTGDWWYNNPAAGPKIGCDGIDGGFCTGVELPIVSAAPSDAEARTLAQELFGSTGFDIAADQIDVVADQWQTTATANLVVDGVVTALSWSVTWSNTGAISWANGHSIMARDEGSYGTVSANNAVDRLVDGRWYGSPGPAYQGEAIMYSADLLRGDTGTGAGPSVKPGVGTEPTPGDEQTVDPTAPMADPEIPPATPEPIPTADPVPTVEPEPILPVEPTLPAPEVVEVTIDEAEATLLLMWDSAGDAWLVPGFAMRMPEGWWNSVVSLVPGVIEIPEPIAVEPFTFDDRLYTKD
ncbi:hypothetical protein [Salinibacterium sp.]|uniref:hypothetical protein n=2 Tax=Salinibacterium sp. TaxID=1915057 RepID=UPI00286B2380|nr:hypothetical protein [Salinibacterium sp.]